MRYELLSPILMIKELKMSKIKLLVPDYIRDQALNSGFRINAVSSTAISKYPSTVS